MNDTKKHVNPWTPEDEREHFPSKIEWWCTEAFFKTVENNKKWSLKVSLSEWYEKPKKGSVFYMTLFNRDNNKHFTLDARNNSEKLESARDNFDIRYEDSFMKGAFPNYEMYFNDKKNNIKLDIKYQAEALPHWIAQDITDGWLPIGLGFYRYGFIPKGDLSGTIKINNKTFTIEGKGYFEHVWGNFFYNNPILQIKGLKKTIAIYARLIGWHFLNQKPCFPNSMTFGTENNPFGYDWAWALLDNGWILFYGNILFWLMKGPVAGSLILSKDGKTYEEFADVHFKYNETRHAQSYDFLYPSDLEITAKKGKEKLHLRFTAAVDSREFISRFPKGKYWLGFVICEAPGIVDGYYFDGKKKTNLSGICKIEPQRQVTIFGHNSLRIDFLKPPKGVGISFDLESHYFRKKLFTQIQLAPSAQITFNFKRIDNPKRKIPNRKQ